MLCSSLSIEAGEDDRIITSFVKRLAEILAYMDAKGQLDEHAFVKIANSMRVHGIRVLACSSGALLVGERIEELYGEDGVWLPVELNFALIFDDGGFEYITSVVPTSTREVLELHNHGVEWELLLNVSDVNEMVFDIMSGYIPKPSMPYSTVDTFSFKGEKSVKEICSHFDVNCEAYRQADVSLMSMGSRFRAKRPEGIVKAFRGLDKEVDIPFWGQNCNLAFIEGGDTLAVCSATVQYTTFMERNLVCSIFRLVEPGSGYVYVGDVAYTQRGLLFCAETGKRRTCTILLP